MNFRVIHGWLPWYWPHSLTLLAVISVAVWSVTWRSGVGVFSPRPGTPVTVDNEIDAALAQAATIALDRREGTIIVLDPQTGRLRAVINPQVAFDNSYAPGSTIKPFTALAALQAGLIDKDSRAVCREHYVRHGFSTVCAHPRDLPSFDPSSAIAYSCNYYFGRLGEQLSEEQLSNTLSAFGFGNEPLLPAAPITRGYPG